MLTRWDGRMSKASIYDFGRSGNSDLMGLNADRGKLMTLKLILVAS